MKKKIFGLFVLAFLLNSMVFSKSLEEITNDENYKKMVELAEKYEALSKRTEIVLKTEKLDAQYGSYSFKVPSEVEGARSETGYSGAEGSGIFWVSEYSLDKNISGVTPEELALSTLETAAPKDARILAREKGKKSGYVIYITGNQIAANSITCFNDSIISYIAVMSTDSGYKESFLNVYMDMMTSVKKD